MFAVGAAWALGQKLRFLASVTAPCPLPPAYCPLIHSTSERRLQQRFLASARISEKTRAGELARIQRRSVHAEGAALFQNG